MSYYSEVASFALRAAQHREEPADLNKVVNLLFTKLATIAPESDRLIHELLKCIYKLRPEIFVVVGGVKGGEDGRSYFTLQVHHCNSNYTRCHIYGQESRGRFAISDVEIYHYGKTYYIPFEKRMMTGGHGGAPKFWDD